MAEEKQAEKTNAAVQNTAAPQQTAAVENAIEVYVDKAQVLTKQTQKQIEQKENPARAKLTGFTIKILKRNKSNGGIEKIAKTLNDSMIAARREFVAKETSIAEKEAKMDAKFNEAKVSEGNNNILGDFWCRKCNSHLLFELIQSKSNKASFFIKLTSNSLFPDINIVLLFIPSFSPMISYSF